MRLRSARITNFKSIEDTTDFGLDELTCLVGKNEAGKTAVLQALYRLNPVDGKAAFIKDTEYPRRHLAEYASRHADGPANVLETTWELEPDDLKTVHGLVGPKALQSPEFEVTKGYAGQQLWDVKVDEAEAFNFVLARASLTDQEKSALAAQGTAVTIQQLKEIVAKVPEPTPGIQKLNATVNERFKRGTAALGVIDALKMPKFVYFSQYDRMSGQAAIDQIINRRNQNALTREDEIIISFLTLAGSSLDDIQKTTVTEVLIANLEAVSSRISKTIFKYWTQNRHLKVQIRLDQALPGDPPPYNSGRILRTRIYNSHHEVTVPFDDRSTGFVWFFSFLVYFSQIEQRHGNNLILLLDEPGLSLHAKAQGDLLRYFREQLLPKQVIYTTHSPFLVPADNLMQVRTVEDVVVEDEDGDVEILGTKVGSEVLSQDRDTLFPLQGALGYDLTQALFVGAHSLVVEGPADLLYLHSMSASLTKAGRTGLDRRWTVTPARGLDRIASFLALLGAQNLNIAVLTDFGVKQRKSIEDLRKRHDNLLKQGRIFTADRYADQPEADIEDVLGAELYVHLVNSAYALRGDQRVTLPSGPPKRIAEHVEVHFRKLPTTVAEYDHYSPAEHLGRSPAVLDDAPGLPIALDRFERLFTDLNSLLPVR
jgi:hypothetical protein